MLANANKKRALARGRKPGGFVAMTYVLWFGMEIIGAFIGAILELGYGIYVVALVSAGVGGLISYLLAKNCKPGNYYPQQMPYAPMPSYAPPQGPYGAPMYAQPEPPAEPLDMPATVEIARDTSTRGEMTSWTFTLNGETVGSLGSGASRRTMTKQRQNTLRAVSDDGRECMPLRFNVESGGSAIILFSIDRFVPQGCSGIFPLQYAQPAAPFPPYGQPNTPPPYGVPNMPPPYNQPNTPNTPPPYGAPNMPPPYNQPGTPYYGQYYAPPPSPKPEDSRDKPEQGGR